MFFGASEASADCFQSRKHTQNSPSFRRGGKIFEENFDGVVSNSEKITEREK
jgi:hypothetical protein